MSGGFNFGQPSAGFAFGAQKPTAATAAATGTGFGMTSSTPAAPGGGFAFGTTAQATPNPAGSFSFGTPAKSTAAGGGGFSFGTPTPSFGMSTPQTTAAAPAGMALGSAAPTAGSGFTMGSGLPAQTTAAAPAGGGFAFGTPSQAQAQPQLAAPPTATVAATTGGFGGFSFGATKVQATTPAAPVTAPTAAPGGGFSFDTSAPSNLTLGAQPQPAHATATTAGQGGGFTFGIKPSSTPAPPAASQAASAPGPSLFALPISTAAAVAAATAAATAAAATAASTGTGFTLGGVSTLAASTAAATTAAGGGLSFMMKPLGAATITSASASVPPSTVAAATTGAATGFALGLKPPSSASIISTTTATTIPTSSAPPVMTYAQLEGLINKWSLELEDQERHFLQQATQVNAWDRMLVENGEKITALHKEMEKVKLDQRRLNQELDFILSQQKELEDLLCPLEESVKEQSGTIYMQNADEERERTYKLAENVDAQLKRMSQDLKEIIEHLNTSSGPADTSDPLQQICKILNTHMDSLQWIDQNSVLLQRRVEEVSKLCDNQRKEQEKTFRLTFD
ncbi:nucleoporin 62 like [Etheostoma cragini]|uniref:nucleoporin 62 like n=1 Tax=Etheostoma cragini TaxID=417921 RepID=UPI00155F1E0A|nr:nucleoporin 62 like [Etheostoma cragini]